VGHGRNHRLLEVDGQTRILKSNDHSLLKTLTVLNKCMDDLSKVMYTIQGTLSNDRPSYERNGSQIDFVIYLNFTQNNCQSLATSGGAIRGSPVVLEDGQVDR